MQQAAVLLQEGEQSPPPSIVVAMKAITEALVLPSLLRHKDEDVKLLVASCISEIMRIFAPEAPYDDDVLKDIFQLIVNIFQGLNEVSSPSFPRRVNILFFFFFFLELFFIALLHQGGRRPWCKKYKVREPQSRTVRVYGDPDIVTLSDT
ncbi:hypothetical protein R1sor_007509 [Riccia sorocarpa]|uniref:Sister chromatid cohesion protein n=1 Tax=Riccia sorocarpa TaxID=122646 RepID=A0ABD3HQP3_9MARC